METSKDTFRFFVPIDILSKAEEKDTKGNRKMRIGGIASTGDRDLDDEILDQDGLDTEYLLKSGFFNWHHQSSKEPAAIIGEPDVAEITKDGLRIEGDLYSDSKLANDVYDLALLLKKGGSKRKLGYSIEGKVTERDPLDEKHIKKAKVTGIAITPSPKNWNSYLDIIKGDYTDYKDEYEYDQGSGSPDGGEVQYILDVQVGDRRITVDKSFNVQITEIDKALTTVSGRALIRESVEGTPKELMNYKKKKYDDALLTITKGYELGLVNDDQLDAVKTHLQDRK